MERRDSQPVSVIWFGMDASVMDMLEPLEKWKDSHLFKKVWRDFGERAVSDLMQDEKLSFEAVAKDVWLPTEKECRRIYRELKSGSITLGELSQNFGDLRGNYETMKKEWETLSIAEGEKSHQWIEETMEKVRRYQYITQYREGANVMMQVKDAFNLSGDFVVLEVLAKSVSGRCYTHILTNDSYCNGDIAS